MRAYEHQDIPGVDVLTQYNRDYWVVKQAASVARQMGGEIILAGKAPFMVDVTESDEASDFLREASSHVVYDAEGIAGAALRSAGRVAGAADVNGTEIGEYSSKGEYPGIERCSFS